MTWQPNVAECESACSCFRLYTNVCERKKWVNVISSSPLLFRITSVTVQRPKYLSIYWRELLSIVLPSVCVHRESACASKIVQQPHEWAAADAMMSYSVYDSVAFGHEVFWPRHESIKNVNPTDAFHCR